MKHFKGLCFFFKATKAILDNLTALVKCFMLVPVAQCKIFALK